VCIQSYDEEVEQETGLKKNLGDKSTLYMKTDRVSQNSGYKHG